MNKINSLKPKNNKGYQFVIYADSCSGIPDRIHGKNLSRINKILERLNPAPEFICFPGDEISGLINDEAELRKQWSYWKKEEMNYVFQNQIPFYNTTGNHTTYNKMSEKIFKEVFSNLPLNGPQDQKGLSYYIIKNDLLMIFVNTCFEELGGEGRVETDWIEKILNDNNHIKQKIVFGHHPVFPINGFYGDFVRNIEVENGIKFWNILVKYNVLAYFCSHMLAFDVQVNKGVLQILTAGAGTPYRMPKDIEYLHLVQASLDSSNLVYQVIDIEGEIKEWLSWPLYLKDSIKWNYFTENEIKIKIDNWNKKGINSIIIFDISCDLKNKSNLKQTIICGKNNCNSMPCIWIGLTGHEKRLTIYLSPEPNRSPHHWYGPCFESNNSFQIQIALHNGMGPGGILWRFNEKNPWSSFTSSSPWGLERIRLIEFWSKNLNSTELLDSKNKSIIKYKIYEDVLSDKFLTST